VGTLAATAFAPHRLQPAITGQTTDEPWRSAIVTDLAEACGSMTRAHAAVTAWSELIPRVDPAVVALLAQARAVASVALVSNATTRLEWDLERQGVSNVADVVVHRPNRHREARCPGLPHRRPTSRRPAQQMPLAPILETHRNHDK
jgi:putative hydrolase of the HAD superfamily